MPSSISDLLTFICSHREQWPEIHEGKYVCPSDPRLTIGLTFESDALREPEDAAKGNHWPWLRDSSPDNTEPMTVQSYSIFFQGTPIKRIETVLVDGSRCLIPIPQCDVPITSATRDDQKSLSVLKDAFAYAVNGATWERYKELHGIVIVDG